MGRNLGAAFLAAGVAAWLALVPVSAAAAQMAAPPGGGTGAQITPALRTTDRSDPSSTASCAPAPPPVPQILESGGTGAGVAPPAPSRVPSGLLDTLSGGVFGSAFWPNPSRVPGHGPYAGGAGQGQPTRRDPPGTAVGESSPVTFSGSFR